MRFRRALIAALGVGAVAGGREVRAEDPPAEPPRTDAPPTDPQRADPPPADPPSSAAPRADPPPTGPRPAEDPRATFGLSRQPAAPQTQVSCDDGLAFDCAIATDPLDDATPYGLTTWLPASYLRRLPVGDATHDAVAHYALGAGRDEAGVVIGGATGLESRWTIDGAPADNIRTGAVDTRVPLAFLDGILISAGGFSARDRASTGGTIDARLRRGTPDHEISADAWLTLSRAPSVRPSASGSFTVRKLTSEPGPAVSAAVVATGPLPLPDALSRVLGAWYAAGIAPRLATTSLRWHAVRVVDADNDGIPDGLPGDVVTAPIEDTSTREIDYTVPVMARVGFDGGPLHVELSLIGHVAHDARFLGNATLQAAGVDRRILTGDAIATVRGTWPDVRARLQLTWHRSSQVESARDPAAAHIPQLLTAYVPTMLPEDPPLATICDDTSPLDPARNVATCPVPFGFFASGGAGPLVELVGDRPTATGDVTYRLGRHVVRGGAALEDTRLVSTTSFTGNEQQRSLFPGELSHRRFYAGTCTDDIVIPCDYTTGSQLTYRTVYAAIYAEDTFTPRDGLSIDGGLRGELMWVGTRLHFSSELSPRIGVAWDVLGGGRSRLWASLGRTFAMLPAGLGTTVIQRDAVAEEFELAGAMARVHDAGAAFFVEPRARPVQQDEVTLGAEFALAGALRATLWGQGRFLRHGLETTPNGFDNPGSHGDVAATRETEVVALQLELRRAPTLIRAGVLWGRTVGSWAGPFDPRQGVNLLDGPDWDFDPTNLYGRLPTSFGGRVFVEAERRATLGTLELAVATRLTAASGRPRNVLADGIDGIVELLPRGSAGNGPVITQVNLRLAARWRGIDVTLDVLNLFDRRDPTNLDEVYSDDAVRPISGGSTSDLVFLKSVDGSAAHRRTAFQLPVAYQAPLSAVLGIHKAF